MRHRSTAKTLGRRSAHRKALLANLATSLFTHERITTTLLRAKVLRSFAERLITTARQDTLHARRLDARVVRDEDILTKVFAQLAPRYADRPGGYTRIYKLGYRRGDSAEMAVVEMVDRPTVTSGRAAKESGGRARKLVERDPDTAGRGAGDEPAPK